jgi:hypothetical protein
MEISIELPHYIKESYGLKKEDVEIIKKILFDDIDNAIANIYNAHYAELRNSETLRKIESETARSVFKGMSKEYRVEFEATIGDARLSYKTMLNSMMVCKKREKYKLNEFLLHVAIIKADKAFIKIK